MSASEDIVSRGYFSGSSPGLVRSSNGGVTDFLRADGVWAVPPGAGAPLTDGDKGDITVATGGTAWSVDAGSIGTSKLGGDITTAGKALLDDATATVQRATLGLAAIAASGDAADLSGILNPARIASGALATSKLALTAETNTFLRGDGAWTAAVAVASTATPSRILGTAFQPSATRPVLAYYSARITSTLTLTTGARGRVELLCDSANPPTTVRARVAGGNTGTLSIGVSTTDTTEAPLVYLVPAGHYVLLQSVNETGTPTYSITTQAEQTL